MTNIIYTQALPRWPFSYPAIQD